MDIENRSIRPSEYSHRKHINGRVEKTKLFQLLGGAETEVLANNARVDVLQFIEDLLQIVFNVLDTTYVWKEKKMI